MPVVEFRGGAAQRHPEIFNRVRVIWSADLPGPRQPVVKLVDEAETALATPLDPGARALTLARGRVPALIAATPGTAAALHYADPWSEATLAALVAAVTPAGSPIAHDVASLSILALGERLAASNIPVLINGPTGTGKEVLSRFIHDHSDRADKPFIAINCAAVPEAMLEALLFGHQKGAFTGAAQANEGFFRAADGGTLLLDEIAEMPLGLQAKLLRALQESEVTPLGATQPVKVDVRIIACANRDLPGEVAEGRFRADLFYRLNVFPLALAPLCERRADIAPLAFALLLRHREAQSTVQWIGDDALAMLAAHNWPGNVRELENVVRRALLMAGDARTIAAQHIIFDRPARLIAQAEPADFASSDQGGGRLANIVQLSESRAITDTLNDCFGNRAEAARRLGISERTLRYRLASFRDAGMPTVAGGRR